jgi:hypothetical protein
VTFVASTGDYGAADPEYPAYSPNVVAVGGTSLTLNADNSYNSETGWGYFDSGAGTFIGSGGGISQFEPEPSYQQGVQSTGKRTIPDVAFDADPDTGVAVYDTYSQSGWLEVGGTSVASPIIASTFALAGGAGKDEDGQAVEYPARTLYENLSADPGALHDVVSGSNGVCSKGFSEAGLSNCSAAEAAQSCSAAAICSARSGYDGPSGVGTPDGLAAFEPDRAPGGSPTGQEEVGTGSGSEGAGGLDGGQGEASESEFGDENEDEGEAAGKSRGASAHSAAGKHAKAKAGRTVPLLSAPALTKATLAQLAHARARTSQLQFAFTVNRATHVHVTLARLVDVRGQARSQTLAPKLTIAAGKGRDQASLKRRDALAPGRYRLTLAPAAGSARSLVFTVG